MTPRLRVEPIPTPALPAGRPNLLVTGFMGTGKTSAGRAAAERLGLPFVDLDEVVASRAGTPVPDLFAREGEAAFRALERTALEDAARLSGAVVATGGGAVLHDGAFPSLASTGAVAVLTADAAELARRLEGGAGRPLLASDPPARIEALLAERGEAYRAAGPGVPTSGRTLPEVASDLAARWERRAAGAQAGIEVAVPGGITRVLVRPGSLASLGREVRSLLPDARIAVVVADGAVDAGAGAGAAASLAAAGVEVARVSLPAGEAAKRLATLGDLWERFAEAGLDRSGVVVAVGGGAALDVAGFAAATFARGVTLVNVPTTLLAMADASLGGKTAVDHAGVKNAAGVFHHPALVVTDPETLATLPAAVLSQGLAEIVKAFVIASPLGLDVLEDWAATGEGREVIGRDPAALAWLVEQAVRVKAAFVQVDPDDRGVRHALNLGHTFAHAVESSTGYAVPHGDAVAMGLVAAAALGERLDLAPAGLRARLERLLPRLGLPVHPPAGLDLDAARRAVGADKKRRGGRPVFVVPIRGGVAAVEGLDAGEVLDALLLPAADPDAEGVAR